MNDKTLSTAPKPFVFVLMPFDKMFDDVYVLGIKETAKEVGAYAERVDEQIFNEGILERVFNQINKADVIIADMTGRNPNVFYEVGYAHALEKTVLLLTQKADDIPFDLKNRQHIVYGSEGNKIQNLRERLTRSLIWAINESRSKGKEKYSKRILVSLLVRQQVILSDYKNVEVIKAKLDCLSESIPTINIPRIIESDNVRYRKLSYLLTFNLYNNSSEDIPVITKIYLLTPFYPFLRPIYSSFRGHENFHFTLEKRNSKNEENSSRKYFFGMTIPFIPPNFGEDLEVVLEEEDNSFLQRENYKLVINKSGLYKLRIQVQDNYYDFPFFLNLLD
jgi:hypothetical protein